MKSIIIKKMNNLFILIPAHSFNKYLISKSSSKYIENRTTIHNSALVRCIVHDLLTFNPQIFILLITSFVQPVTVKLRMPVPTEYFVELVCDLPLKTFMPPIGFNITLIVFCRLRPTT